MEEYTENSNRVDLTSVFFQCLEKYDKRIPIKLCKFSSKMSFSGSIFWQVFENEENQPIITVYANNVLYKSVVYDILFTPLC